MIDYSFISQLEGSKLSGYVPDPQGSQSGVTIASNFDIGQHSTEEITRAFKTELARKLSPYIGMKRQQAVDFLLINPLDISETEEEQINIYSHSPAEKRLVSLWYKSDAQCDFDSLASPCQTVIASVAFQYEDLAKNTPTFWHQVVEQQWGAAIANLRDFDDKYPTRRNREADLLQDWYNR